MKRIQTYKSFRESNPIKEEFFDKFVRRITGENKKRVEEVLSILDIESRKKELNDLISTLPSFITKDDFLYDFNQEWIKSFESYAGQNLIDKVGDLVKNIYIFDISKIKEILNDKLSDLNSSEWISIKADLYRLDSEISKTESIFSDIKKDILVEFRKKLKDSKKNFEINFKNDIKNTFNEDILYFGNYLNSDKCDPERIKELPTGRGLETLPAFVRALCLRLDNNLFNVDNYRDEILNSYSSGYHTYIDEIGPNYKEKFVTFLDKPVVDLPVFKNIEKSVNSIRNIIDDRIKKTEKQNKIVDEFVKVSDNKDFTWELYYEDKHSKGSDQVIELDNDLKNNDAGYDKCSCLNPWSIVTGFDWVKSALGDKKVSDFINNKKPTSNTTITVEKSDSKTVRYENGQKICGNVYYFGTIHTDVTMKTISNYVNKTGGVYIVNPETRAIALYCTNYPSGAAQYANTRTHQTMKFRTLDRFCPTVYKITLKEGTKFLEGADVSIDEKEKSRLKSLGYVGVHSENQEVGGGQTVEVSIIDPECIENVEKVPLSEINKIDDTEWSKGSKSPKDVVMKQLEEWERIHLRSKL